ncbi:MAG: type II toxin-antitoxin system RelB/DinJ family antitoxin [Candidatus Ornithomonoglobus sp.]
MATISTRVDDKIKSDAEKVADEIGIPVSTAINIFLKRFIANRGFPFNVVAPERKKQTPIVNVEMLDASVKEAIADPNNIGLSHQFTYLDPNTKQPVTIIRKE